MPPELCVMLGLTDDMVQDTELMKNISHHTKLTPVDKVSNIDDIMKLITEKQGIVKVNKETNELITLRSASEKMNDYGLDISLSGGNLFNGYSMVHPVVKSKDNSKLII